MYTIAIDTHTHSLFSSSHADCTHLELWAKAAEVGLNGFGITHHMGSRYTRSNGRELDAYMLFSNYGHVFGQRFLPRFKNGVKLYRSVEIDIAKKDGSLFAQNIKDDSFSYPGKLNGDVLSEMFFNQLDYAIASVHQLDDHPQLITKSEGTAMYINAMSHPKVFILGHIDRPGIPFDISEVVKAVKVMGKAIEINEVSFVISEKSCEMCKEIAIHCAEIGTQIAVGSDAHEISKIGVFSNALTMLEEIGFPEELIVNGNVERFEKAINYCT